MKRNTFLMNLPFLLLYIIISGYILFFGSNIGKYLAICTITLRERISEKNITLFDKNALLIKIGFIVVVILAFIFCVISSYLEEKNRC